MTWLRQMKPKTRRVATIVALLACVAVVAGVLLKPRKKEPVDIEKAVKLFNSMIVTAANSPPPDLVVSIHPGSELSLSGPALGQKLTVFSLDELSRAIDQIKKPAAAQVVSREGGPGLLDIPDGGEGLCSKRCQEVWQVLLAAGFSRSKGLPRARDL